MKRTTSVTLGIVLLIFGVLWLLYLLGVIDSTFVFDGWWTLFIIVPSLYSLFTSRHKVGPVLALGIGVLLLLAAQGVIYYSMVGRLFLAILIIVIGLALIVGRRRPQPSVADISTVSRDGKDIKQINATFGEHKVNFDNQRFQGADISSSFGSVKVDLRQALISEDIIISLDCSFSGIVLLCPADLNVQVSTNNFLGGISDKRTPSAASAHRHTLYLTGTLTLSGVDIL